MSKKTSAKKAKAPVDGKTKKFSLIGGAYPDKDEVPKLADIDRKKDHLYRWTRAFGARAGKQGKFIRVGVPPKKLDTKAINPPLVSASKLGKYILKGGEKYDENDKRASFRGVVTTLPLHELAHKFPDRYKNDLEDVLYPIYILGSVKEIIKQLTLQNVLPQDFGANKNEEEWLKGYFINSEKFSEWSDDEEYQQLVGASASKKKKEELAEVNYEDVYKVLALSKALSAHKVRVLDVNGSSVGKFGQEPKKSINNVFSDAALKFIKRAIEDENYEKSHILVISTLSRRGMEKVVPEVKPKRKDGASSNSNKFEVEGLNGLAFLHSGVKLELEGKVYSDNSEAVGAFLKEIAAVNASRKVDYKFKGLRNEANIEDNFSNKLSQMHAGRLAKKKALDTIDLD